METDSKIPQHPVSDPDPIVNSETHLTEPASQFTRIGSENGNTFGIWLSGWICLLTTVFFSGSTLNCFLHWLPFGHPWDLGGTILSGLLAWLCYAWTLSDKTTVPAEKRGSVSLGLAALWLLSFPAVMLSLGFK
ncbi:hypothetical protein AUK22_09415 [bacterium CG2_30_54_10]|nr:MAG: hypothetical protein AUK22_09415 [bacterium CG2_30_54_10]